MRDVLPSSTPDAWDGPLKLLILAGLGLLAFASIPRSGFQPAFPFGDGAWNERRAAAAQHSCGFAMGTLLLIFRTLLWFTYRPHTPARLETARA